MIERKRAVTNCSFIPEEHVLYISRLGVLQAMEGFRSLRSARGHFSRRAGFQPTTQRLLSEQSQNIFHPSKESLHSAGFGMTGNDVR